MTTPTDFLRLALDPMRLAVLGHAAVGPIDTRQLCESLGTDERSVLDAVAALRTAGLLDADLRLDRAALIDIARRMPTVEPAADSVVAGPWSREEVDVLSRFFVGTRLREIPANAAKRAVVLERLAQQFEPGVRYEEQEVNRRLLLFHPDYAALRRYLVDSGLLTRAGGVYWRTGGRYEA